MILMIDNYDSFVYNLCQLAVTLGKEVAVYRNDAISIGQVKKLEPEAIIISPGPGNPAKKREFGVCTDILKETRDTKILGVCLGHQGIIHAFGGKIVRNEPMHGKTSMVGHNGEGIFKGVKNPFSAMRYHSLVGTEIPECLEVTATSLDDNKVMAVQHKTLPIFGVQFHPESIMTEEGKKIFENFLRC